MKKRHSFEFNTKWFSWGIITCIILAFIVAIIGPFRIKMFYKSWVTSGYGSSWLVMQYSANGDVIHYWELKKTAICNESQSDGIYFLDSNGNVVHLSGNYTYIEVKKGNWDTVRKRYVKEN